MRTEAWEKFFIDLQINAAGNGGVFNGLLLQQIEELEPDLVLVTGILPLSIEIFKSDKKHGGLIVNYQTDDPWNPIHKAPKFH